MQRILAPIFSRQLSVRLLLLGLLAIAPAAFIATRVAEASRDIVYWDEFDTALHFLLRLDTGMGAGEFVSRLFDVSNEHRMVTSRMMFALSYWLTGTVNFSVIGWIGNASLLGLCGLLVFTLDTPARRLRMALVLGMLMFQLQHYENFLWSGSSIDHFLVVTLAGAAVCGLANGTRPGLLIGLLCALLATFTLAHGIVVWGVGLAMLWYARRWANLGAWCAVGVLAAAGFLTGFHVNTAQRFVEPSLAGALVVVQYWLSLLGAPPALGHQAAAPWLGLALLAALGGIAFRGGLRRETIAFPLACYAIAALALIATGRAAESAGMVHSRYFVLSALAWALVVFMWLDRFSHPRRPYFVLWACVPALLGFNLVANHQFDHKADTWVECRDRAAVRFTQHGTDGRGAFALYPTPTRSTELLHEAERRGVYRMGTVCEEVEFPDAQPSARIAYFVEELSVNGRAAAVVGWAAIPGLPSKRGELHVVLRSPEQMHVFTAVTITRPDVADALKRREWTLSGFRFACLRDRLPIGEYEVGFLVAHDEGEEFIITGHKVRLVGDGEARLAGQE